MKRYTSPQHLLLAALRLHESGESFSREDLVVAAHAAAPALFGLAGYEDRHVDTTKVFSLLMGERRLIRRGYFELVRLRNDGRREKGMLRLTDLGRREAAALLGGPAPVLTVRPAFPRSREREAALVGLLDHPAVRQYRAAATAGVTPDLASAAALAFVAAATKRYEIHKGSKTIDHRTVLQIADAALVGGEFTLKCGRCVAAIELDWVGNCLAYCQHPDRRWNRKNVGRLQAV